MKQIVINKNFLVKASLIMMLSLLVIMAKSQSLHFTLTRSIPTKIPLVEKFVYTVSGDDVFLYEDGGFKSNCSIQNKFLSESIDSVVLKNKHIRSGILQDIAVTDKNYFLLFDDKLVIGERTSRLELTYLLFTFRLSSDRFQFYCL